MFLPEAVMKGILPSSKDVPGQAIRRTGRPFYWIVLSIQLPVWITVVEALNCLKPGGRLVINAIRKEEGDKDYLLSLDYSKHLWMEKEIKSVANVTRRDVEEFIRLAAEMPFKPEVEEYSFENANQAIMDIKNRSIRGAKVLVMK